MPSTVTEAPATGFDTVGFCPSIVPLAIAVASSFEKPASIASLKILEFKISFSDAGMSS